MFRSHQRSIRRALLVALVIALLAFAPYAPALALVCTLADHIKSANTKTAVGFCPAGTSHDIIAITEDITLTEPLPAIRGTITIEGGGHTISGGGEYRIFDVDGGRLTINNLTLTRGHAPPTPYPRTGALLWPGGGAIKAVNSAVVVVNNSVLSRNYGENGGAIRALHSQVTVHSSSFFDNEASSGGAIWVRSSQLAVHNSSFVDNQGGTGGAISLLFSTSTISNSSFVGNRAGAHGGAIYLAGRATSEITNSSFYDNRAVHGGAVATNLGQYRPSTTLTHVTMVNNQAEAGLSVWIEGNDRNFRIRNSIIAGIVGRYQFRKQRPRICQGPLSENSGNFIEDGSCASMAGGDPMLGEMTGSPAYFPLLDGSPALDAADARYCTETDQLGRPRPIGAGCDIGAIESTTAMPVPTPAPGVCPLPDQIIAANTDRAVGSCPAGNGADTIHMIRDFTLEAKLPPITSDITLEGNGYTISGDNQFGLFEIDGGALTISNVTLTAGQASRGGAIQLKNGGSAKVADVVFRENSAFFGGAIATESESDRLIVRVSSFVDNDAETSGGAIAIDGGNADISSSAFVDNRAAMRGGAIAMLRGRVDISNGTLSGNTALKGGGIYSNGAAATLTHLTLMNNSAEHVIGAGVFAEAGAVHLLNSIVAGSGSGDDCSGRFARQAGNFSQDGRCASEIGGDPALADRVGSPAHYPLLDRSRAHGRADKAYCLPTDQLGNARPHCDIGAIESARDTDIVSEPETELSVDCTLADQIHAANRDEPVGACPAGEGADVIRLRRNITLSAPLPAISSDLTIDGYGHTISGDGRFHVLDIESGNVVLKHIALADGWNPDGYGGAVTVRNQAQLLVMDASFRNSEARYGGGVASIGASHLYVFESSFLDNEASSKGGALWRDGVCGYFDDIVFRRNKAGELPGSIMDDYLTHIDGGASRCTDAPESYTLSDS
ncbi:MAG: hypothetical protein OXI77_17170 [Chloroflexota bacterium]|nr:hypothetical protein [Chloroflexota bacterium]MDE2910999.1 hypothetical protein [Chloroflexota bacterium]